MECWDGPRTRGLDFYVAREGKQHGPLTEQQFLEDVSAGRIAAGDLVYLSGWAEWKSLDEARSVIPELPVVLTVRQPDVVRQVVWGGVLVMAVLAAFVVMGALLTQGGWSVQKPVARGHSPTAVASTGEAGKVEDGTGLPQADSHPAASAPTYHWMEQKGDEPQTGSFLKPVKPPAFVRPVDGSDSYVTVTSLKVAQSGADVVVRGTGRNSGSVSIRGLRVRAKNGEEVDGIDVTTRGRPADVIAVGGTFEFELYFYGSRKYSPVFVWFTLEDGDLNPENDVKVRAVWKGSEPSWDIAVG